MVCGCLTLINYIHAHSRMQICTRSCWCKYQQDRLLPKLHIFKQEIAQKEKHRVEPGGGAQWYSPSVHKALDFSLSFGK